MITIRIKNKKYSVKWMSSVVIFTEIKTGINHVYNKDILLETVITDLSYEYPDGIPF